MFYRSRVCSLIDMENSKYTDYRSVGLLDKAI